MEDALQKLEIYRLSHDLSIRTHAMSLKLPTFERFEEASQVRRSSKRVNASIVEGHTHRRYQRQYLAYLYRALGSSDETQEHLLVLKETGSLSDLQEFGHLLGGYEDLSKKIFRFIGSVEARYETPNYLQESDDIEPEAPA
jgi:four helix bundle protein